ncbi:MAG: hypothetical protein ACQESF_01185 [Nanobdellota archaeon]
MDIIEKIKEDMEDEMDIYSEDVIDDLEDNGEIDSKEAAFMRGFNRART